MAGDGDEAEARTGSSTNPHFHLALCVCVCVNIFFNYGQAALNPEQFPVGPYNWHYKSHFTLICERKKKRNKEIERGRGGRGSKRKLRSLYKLLISGRRRSRSSSSRGKWENGKAANQQNDYPNSQLPPATPLLPPPRLKNLQRKIYFTILCRLWSPESCTCYPRLLAEAWNPRGMGQAVCVTLSDSLKREESAIRERGWGGVQTKHSTRFWQN